MGGFSFRPSCSGSLSSPLFLLLREEQCFLGFAPGFSFFLPSANRCAIDQPFENSLNRVGKRLAIKALDWVLSWTVGIVFYLRHQGLVAGNVVEPWKRQQRDGSWVGREANSRRFALLVQHPEPSVYFFLQQSVPTLSDEPQFLAKRREKSLVRAKQRPIKHWKALQLPRKGSEVRQTTNEALSKLCRSLNLSKRPHQGRKAS